MKWLYKLLCDGYGIDVAEDTLYCAYVPINLSYLSTLAPFSIVFISSAHCRISN